MARYNAGALYDDGHLYDESVGVLTVDEDAVAGQSPALPDRAVPWRAACAEIWGFNPLTWLPTTKLAHVSDSATRQASLTDLGRQTETLTFDVAAPLTLDLLEGDWIAVLWNVATPTAATAYLAGVYRLTDAPSMDRDASGTLYHAQAIDWYSYFALAEKSPSGWYRAALLSQAALDYVADGGTIIGNTSPPYELATWLAAFLWGDVASPASGLAAPLHVEPWTDYGIDKSAASSGEFLQITSPGNLTRAADILAWFWPRVAGYQLTYHADGGLILSGKTPTDSGLYLTDDTVILGSVPLPWETVQRTFRRPDVTTVEYYQNNTDGVTVLFGDARAATADHDLNQASVERIVDSGQPVTLAAFPTARDYARWRLSTHLASADTIAVALDSAFPPPPLGRLVAVSLAPPDGSTQGVSGWYRLVSASQPVGVGPASWTLTWWADL